MAEKLYGIVIRYSDKFFENIDTIKEHNKIILSNNEGYVGKFGRPLGQKAANMCSSSDWQTFLIMVKSTPRAGYSFAISKTYRIQRDIPRSDLFPPYYDATNVSCWFYLRAPFKPLSSEDALQWKVSSSQQPIAKALSVSMAGFFLVERVIS